MRFSNTLLYTIAPVVAFVWLSSCNFTSTYTPEFNGKQEAVLTSIDNKYRFEKINIQGRKIIGTGGTHTSLIIDFINGKNIPAQDDKIAVLGQQLVLQIRQTLKDPKEYESYQVKFDVKVIEGDNTTTNTTSLEFKSNEL